MTTSDGTALSPDLRGANLYTIDPVLRGLLGLYLTPELAAHLEPHFVRMGKLAGGRLDELAHLADRNPPSLHVRDRQGRDAWRIEKHPAYIETEKIAFADFGLAAMSHRGGVLNWPDPLPPVAKYALTYLLVQAEFGLCCPLSMTDSLTRTLIRFGDSDLVARYVPGLTSGDLDGLAQGAMFITEQEAGSDVGGVATEARLENGVWRLYGEKWFCSNPDADVALVLARPHGAGPGTKGLGLFLMPRRLTDGSLNRYRVLRLKDKFGSRSMASGEIHLEGAEAYPVGDLDKGFIQMADMINMSRLSNGVRAAGLMRRALHEALHVARNRKAFAKRLIDLPMMRRQLLKMMVPTEQALSFFLYSGEALARANGGSEDARRLTRLLTPLLKFRACRDARKVSGDSMEVRGGSGYIEEWVHPRLVRDAHLGSIWEGTSNIVAQDVLRAVRKEASHEVLLADLEDKLWRAKAAPEALRRQVGETVGKAVALAVELANAPEREAGARQAATALYNATSAVVLISEGSRLAASGGDARRILLARLVLDHRLTARDPLSELDPAMEAAQADALLSDGPLSLARATTLAS